MHAIERILTHTEGNCCTQDTNLAGGPSVMPLLSIEGIQLGMIE
jgi:hypothetical protein